jgi:arylsulfatase A-like enzyme/tetratricopeptide (TPR) repeat protein
MRSEACPAEGLHRQLTMNKRKKRGEASVNAGRDDRRRGSLRWWLAAPLVVAVVGGWLAWGRLSARPSVVRTADQNVLLITIDTLRADALGCYGGLAATPALDRLAEQGTRYTFAHAHAPLTLVSHASILSGLYPFQHGVHDNSGFRFPRSGSTLATRLKTLGFATGAFVGAFPVHSQFGLNSGFDVYDDEFEERALPTDFTISERPATAVVGAAKRWIDQQSGRWFAWVHVFDPHAPYRPPEPFASRYANDLYAGEVAATDAGLAPLLDDVRARTNRPTLIVVTGDHGEALGDHGEQTHGIFAYEATLRVPLLIAQIGGSTPPRSRGTVSDESVRHIDIAPTILDALGVAADPALPGRTLFGEAPPGATISYFEALAASLNRGWAPLTGVLVGREKLVDLPLPELYDLNADAAERENLIDRRPDRRRVLEASLRGFGGVAPGVRRAEDAATVQRLRSLGYVSGSRPAGRKTYTAEDDPKRLIDLDLKIHQAIASFQEGNAARAAALYRDVLAQRPDMATAYEQLSFVYWESGDRTNAIATLQRAVSQGIVDTSIDTKLGMYLTETGHPAQGLIWLQRGAANPAAEIDALNALAIGYARAGRAAEALSTFQRVLAIDPRSAMAWQNIGSLELERGNAAAARDAFQRALDIDANWAAAYTGLGVAEQRLRNPDAAIESWKEAVQREPREFDALYNLATELASAGRHDEAREYAERFVETAPAAEYGEDIRRLKEYLRRNW